MSKFRIVKVVTPEITKNTECVVDFIPRIKWTQHFQVQEKRCFFSPWKLIWEADSLEQARVLKEHAALKTSKYVIK